MPASGGAGSAEEGESNSAIMSGPPLPCGSLRNSKSRFKACHRIPLREALSALAKVRVRLLLVPGLEYLENRRIVPDFFVAGDETPLWLWLAGGAFVPLWSGKLSVGLRVHFVLDNHNQGARFRGSLTTSERGSMKRKTQDHTQTAGDEATSLVEQAPNAEVAVDAGEEDERKPFPKRRPWEHDNQAGVERSTYSDRDAGKFETWLQFRDGKPSDEVRAHMKAQGFHWESKVPEGGLFQSEGAWVRPHKMGSIAQDRLVGERTFGEVVNLILKEKGLVHEPEPDRF